MRASWKPSSTRRFAAVVLAVLTLVVVGCDADSSGESVTGVVSQVTGEFEVESFVIVDDQGASHAFTPARGLTCDGEPLEHLRVHLVERDRITVRYEATGDGTPTATSITHVGD